MKLHLHNKQLGSKEKMITLITNEHVILQRCQ